MKPEDDAEYWKRECEREREQRQKEVGMQEYRGNTVSYIYDKAKCYGDMVHGCVPALAAAGYPIDENSEHGCKEAIATAVGKMAADIREMREALEEIGNYTGEGGPGTPWRDIVRSLGQTARTAIHK